MIPSSAKSVPRTDVYSLGVILYELLTGQLPFPRTRDSILGPLVREPLPPSRLRPGIPDALERICLKCLREHARDRHASAAALAAELDRFKKTCRWSKHRLKRCISAVRDWARREPALAARLAVIAACSVVIWAYLPIAGKFAPLMPNHPAWRLREAPHRGRFFLSEAIMVGLNQIILAAWGLASWGFQRQLTSRGEEGGLQFGWRLVDVVVIAS